MKIKYYAIHYIETEVETKKDVVDKLVGSDDGQFVIQTIEKYIHEHPNYECPTTIVQAVAPTISDAFVSHENGRDYWLIIHTLEKEAETE